MIHDARIVQIGERLPLDEKIGLWTGDSRGYWEDDTLVVETRNFNGLTHSYSAFGDSEEAACREVLSCRPLHSKS